MPKFYFIAKYDYNIGYVIGMDDDIFHFKWINKDLNIVDNFFINESHLTYNTFRFAKSALTKFAGKKLKNKKIFENMFDNCVFYYA